MVIKSFNSLQTLTTQSPGNVVIVIGYVKEGDIESSWKYLSGMSV